MPVSGYPMAPEKSCGPSTVMAFAGTELDSEQQVARLPQDKLDKCSELISSFLKGKKVTLKELRSLIGLLNFACSVIKPGQAFLCRLIDLTTGVSALHHLVKLSLVLCLAISGAMGNGQILGWGRILLF